MAMYRHASKDDINEIAKLCAKSFGEYPLYLMIENQMKKKGCLAEFLYELQLVYTKSFMKKQTIFVGVESNEIVSVVFLENPRRKKIGLFDCIFSGGIKLLKYIRFSDLMAFLSMIESSSNGFTKADKETMWFVSQLAVSKEHQGKKLGSKAIINFIIPYVKHHRGKFLTLTTNTELNSKFYIKNGFKELEKKTLKLKGQSVENWCFRMTL